MTSGGPPLALVEADLAGVSRPIYERRDIRHQLTGEAVKEALRRILEAVQGGPGPCWPCPSSGVPLPYWATWPASMKPVSVTECCEVRCDTVSRSRMERGDVHLYQ